MTSSTRHLKWKLACLALVLICQAARQTEGYSRAADQVTRRPPMKRDLNKYHNTSASETSSKPEQGTSRDHHERPTEDTLNGKIVFPSNDDSLPSRRQNVGTPPVCEDSTFCENVSQYPTQLVDLALQQNSSLKFLMNVDVVDIAQRINDSPDEIALCTASERLVYPQTAKSTRKEWLYVVNQDSYKQGVRVEVCSDQDGHCNVIDGFSNNYQTFCKQKYVARELVALSPNGAAVLDTFLFPASCCCYLTSTGGQAARSAG
ncbi:PREDICTED: protein spaetzle-like isoform X2 [Dinoponera quadriceps]|uniref:Protein spaetzle-like isoform X2 n=1 Tax=Dinoponera quadriceps TaxID=609295 RepID=A0A6P3Y7D5_DINQU|nr:PREDICTED: protein spaetzle-like isoform X2 [Dinoponera quadriceps]